MLNTPVYLDNHSTTRVDPRVVEAMLPWLTEHYGNAGSSSHPFGWDARDAVDEARETIASSLGASPREIVFTSGATESNNLALRGVCERVRRKGNHIVSVRTEHKAMLDPLSRLARQGFDVTLLDVTPHGDPRAGLLDVQRILDALRDDTLLVSVMLANNEIGVLQPLAEIGALCKQRGVLLHTDATQAVGRVPVDVERLQVDLLSFSAHKMYGPMGVGGLYVRRRAPHVRLQPQIEGGGQERGIRAGTLNVPGIVGMSRALALCLEEIEGENTRQRTLRDRLYEGMAERIAGLSLNGPDLKTPGLRLDNNLNCSFPGVDGEALMMSMRDVAVSSGSACTSADPQPSHVLRALGLTADMTRASLRFGLGRFTTEEEIEFAIGRVGEAVQRLRSLGSVA